MFLVELGSWNPIRHCLEISSLIPLKRPPENVSPSEFQCFLDTCKRSNEHPVVVGSLSYASMLTQVQWVF